MNVPFGGRLSLYAWAAAIAAHATLMAGLWLWAGLLPGALIVLPLAAAIPGLIVRSRYTAGWMTLLLAVYCAALLSEAFSVDSRYVLGITYSALAVFEFIALTLFVRWAAREDQALVQSKP